MIDKGGEGVEAIRDALSELFFVCLIAAASDALFDRDAGGVRLICGLSVALCVGRLAVTLLA